MLDCGFVRPVSAAMMVRTSIVAEAVPVPFEVVRRRCSVRAWMSPMLVTSARSSKMATVCISCRTAVSVGLPGSSIGVVMMAFGLDGRCRVTRVGCT